MAEQKEKIKSTRFEVNYKRCAQLQNYKDSAHRMYQDETLPWRQRMAAAFLHGSITKYYQYQCVEEYWK